MSHSQVQAEITIAQFTSAFDIPRSNFQRWRDAVYSGVGESPYTKDELRIIIEEGIRQSQKAVGATRNRNIQKLSRILNQL